nr:hypothetical protein [Tanacetum cinerariifolium]
RVGDSLKVAGKRKQTVESSEREPQQKFPSTKELKDYDDCHFAVAHVTPPLWKRHLKEISLEKLWRLKDKSYAKLERRCNEALQDLDKNPLALDMRSEIKTLQGKIDKLQGEYSRLFLKEKKWVNYEQTLSILCLKVKRLKFKRERLKSSETHLLKEVDGLRQDRVDVVSKVVPHVATKLVCSDEMGLLVAQFVKAAMFCGRCTALEEIAALKEPFNLGKIPGYRFYSKVEFDQDGDDLATVSYLFIAEATADPYASLEELLLNKPKSLRTKLAQSNSKPSSLRALSMATTRNLAPPLAIGNGPPMSIPHWEKAHAKVIDVISCFGFLGMGETSTKTSFVENLLRSGSSALLDKCKLFSRGNSSTRQWEHFFTSSGNYFALPVAKYTRSRNFITGSGK